MQLIDRLLANNLADLEGLEIKGSLPISEALANELISSYMDEFFDNAPPANQKSAESDYIQLLKRLKPDVFQVSFAAGKAVVHLELKR